MLRISIQMMMMITITMIMIKYVILVIMIKYVTYFHCALMKKNIKSFQNINKYMKKFHHFNFTIVMCGKK